MSRYQVYFKRSARKELERLPKVDSDRVLEAIEELENEPRPGNCVKLRGDAGLWRIRCGDYRVVYRIDDTEREVDVMIVRRRSDAYR